MKLVHNIFVIFSFSIELKDLSGKSWVIHPAGQPFPNSGGVVVAFSNCQLSIVNRTSSTFHSKFSALYSKFSFSQGFLYAPFGEITTEYAPLWQNGTLPKYSFNAKELDEETGMYYYEARYYKPPVFTSRDPMFEKYFFMSPYAYCANNPVKYVDPDGREKIICFETKTKNSAENLANQRLKENAKLYKDNPNIVNVFAHGVSAEIPDYEFFRGNISADFLGLALPKNNNLSSPLNGYAKPVQEMYDFIKTNSKVFQNNENNGKGSVIILHSCNSGKGDNSFAQQMSQSDKFKGSVIIAPSDILSSKRVNDKYNKEYVKNNGCWNVFYNGKKISTIDGKVNLEVLQNMLKDQNAVQQYIKACSKYEK